MERFELVDKHLDETNNITKQLLEHIQVRDVQINELIKEKNEKIIKMSRKTRRKEK